MHELGAIPRTSNEPAKLRRFGMMVEAVIKPKQVTRSTDA
jgi:hypothetical protein